MRTGQVAIELLRPVSLVGSYLSRRLGVSAYFMVARMVPVWIVGAAFGLLHFPPNAAAWVPFALSTLLGAWIAVALVFLVDASSFWFESERGVRYVMLGAGVLPSGLLLPVAFFPPFWQAVCMATPFPYTLYVPVQMWLGHLAGEAAWRVLGVQLMWAVGLVALYHAVVARGRRQLQVHGG